VREHSQAPNGDDVQALAARMAETPRGVVVCGAAGPDVAGPVSRLAREAGWPVLADALSGVRCGQHDLSHVVAHYDVLLRDPAFARGHAPDLVLRVGETPTSKPLRAWLGEAEQVVVDPHGVWHEPSRVARTMLHAAPGPTCNALASALEVRTADGDPGWLEAWRRADALVGPALAEVPDPFEPKAYAALAGELPEDAQVWVSSSMPVREVEAFFPSTPRPIRFLANRGANGIDGVVASAAGAALATGRPTWVLIGEVALVHDVGGLLAASRAGADLHVVCVNNGGGGIFDFLPLPRHADPALYEEHVATPTGVEPAALAALAGMQDRFTEVRTDRAESVRLHRELYGRIGEALARQG
jgi:2-succinyl-5-enolpyruvyl-6-hydroxy-3-cyclohexene-1-carboxylate synthase